MSGINELLKYPIDGTGPNVDEAIARRILVGSVAPAATTAGNIGQPYVVGDKVYVCLGKNGDNYVWAQIVDEILTSAEKAKVDAIQEVFTAADKANCDKLNNKTIATTLGNDDSTIPTSKAVQNRIAEVSAGDMLKSVYDTNNDGIVNAADRATRAGGTETLNASGGTHGTSWLMTAQHNRAGDSLFRIFCGDGSIGTSVNRADAASYADRSGGDWVLLGTSQKTVMGTVTGASAYSQFRFVMTFDESNTYAATRNVTGAQPCIVEVPAKFLWYSLANDGSGLGNAPIYRLTTVSQNAATNADTFILALRAYIPVNNRDALYFRGVHCTVANTNNINTWNVTTAVYGRV